jgi:Cytochrome P460
MSSIWTANRSRSKNVPAIAIGLALLVIVGGFALAAQNRYSLKIPDGGLAFSDFRGYEDWRNVSVSQTEHSIKVIAANDPAITAYRSGIPGNGKLFPDGSKFVKIEWGFKKNEASPYSVNVPDTLKSLSFIEKNTKRFPDTHGWAYAQWANDAATDTLRPSELGPSGPECGYACHTKVSAADYIFTAYPKR